ncbi:hypothetical protein [Moraxella lacunata]
MVSELCLRVAENRYGSTGSPRTETVALFHFVECIICNIFPTLSKHS